MNNQRADPVVRLVDDDEMKRVSSSTDSRSCQVRDRRGVGWHNSAAFAITMPDIVELAPPEPSGWGNQDAFLTELQVAKTRAVDRVPEHARDREQEQS